MKSIHKTVFIESFMGKAMKKAAYGFSFFFYEIK